MKNADVDKQVSMKSSHVDMAPKQRRPKSFWGFVSLIGFYVAFALLIVGVWAAISIISALLSGCTPAESCDKDDATRCDDNAVMRCVGGSWEEEDPCDTITTLSGDQYPGVCCVDDNGAYCAVECE